jgi:cyclophilin family peptidyl-prolyl cis-trans isomerase
VKSTLAIVLAVVLIAIPVLSQARAFARWHTSLGSFTAELYDEIVPITANNFISLGNSGFYNNLIFHRVVAGFVIQDGDPLGTGYGGPGYTIPDEFSPLLHHNQAGILAMAHTSAPNSAGSQYYITLAPTPNLDGNYAVFGKVIEGLDVVMAIGSVPVNANSLPLTPVNIYQLRILDLHISNLFPDPAVPVTCNAGDQLLFMIEAETQNAQISYSWYIDDVLVNGQTDFLFEPFIGAGNHNVRCTVASSDSISHNVTWAVQAGSAVSDNLNPALQAPALHCYPNPFKGSLAMEFSLKQPTEVSVDVFNMRGQKVRHIPAGVKDAGTCSLTWDSNDNHDQPCPAGVYILRLNAGNKSSISKNILIR